MKVKKLENITKRDSYLYYRNDYHAMAVFVYGKGKEQESVPVEFSVEKNAAGDTVVNAAVSPQINYPLITAVKKLKEHIENLQKQGSLP